MYKDSPIKSINSLTINKSLFKVGDQIDLCKTKPGKRPKILPGVIYSFTTYIISSVISSIEYIIEHGYPGIKLNTLDGHYIIVIDYVDREIRAEVDNAIANAIAIDNIDKVVTLARNFNDSNYFYKYSLKLNGKELTYNDYIEE